MSISIEDFIGVFEGAYSKEYCDAVIEYFETADKAGLAYTRQQEDSNTPKTAKDDSVVWGDLRHSTEFRDFNKIFWRCYEQYANMYAVLKDSGAHNNYSWKIQKTNPSQGYHVWHYEADTMANSRRLLAWVLYLNDVEEGGETEFLYQSKRVKPKAGTLVIWPASFTHVHRGNPPLSESKYIVTGWVEF